MKKTHVRIAIVAGEPSGDELGGELIQALKTYLPHAEFFGIGGEKMCSHGLVSLFPLEKLAIRGLIEVIRHLPGILTIRHKLKKYILQKRPDIYIGIDAPDFNLSLEKVLKRAGIPTVHYVGPSVWMWRKNRIEKIRQAVSHLLLILPFEKAIWDKAGVAATYVGHPLADTIPLKNDQSVVKRELGIAQNTSVITLLPGSRLSEVEYLSTLLIETAKQLYKQHKNMVFLVPLATPQTHDYFCKAITANEAQDVPIKMILGNAQKMMQAADVVILASGTATLEASLLKKPMVIIYKLNKLTYHLLKNKFYLPYFGLPNIISQRFVVPELIQNAANVGNVVEAVENYLNNPQLCRELTDHFTDLHRSLRNNACDKAAQAVLSILEQHNG